MTLRIRLDTVVEVKQRAEDKAAQSLAKAEAVVHQAATKVAEAQARAAQDFRARADISQWDITELAHHKALTDARKAQRELETAKKSAATVRVEYVNAHQAAEVVRRVAENRREELQRELNRAEDKALDEAASLLFFRRAG